MKELSIDEEITALQSKKREIIEEARATIKKEVNWVDIKPYSHNIISLTLQQVANMCGKRFANQLIDEFQLDELGWNAVIEDK